MTRARSEDERRRASLGASALEVSRLEREQRTRDSEQRGRGEDLRREVAALEGEQARTGAFIESLDHEIERRTVRAPITGRVGELGTFRSGSFVHEGERLAVVVPHGRLRAMGEFTPEGALGRIRPGNAARLRLRGFSWMQYGTVPAVVTRVASELRDGRVRVELELRPDPASVIPLQHGLPASVEVDVEQTTPCRLTLRAAGTLLGQSTQGTPP
jgi:membrane fusion protein (multidrug efflux system)